MNYRAAIEAELGDKSWSLFAKNAKINKSGFYKMMNQTNPDAGWKQLLRIADGLGITWPALARKALKYNENGTLIKEGESHE